MNLTAFPRYYQAIIAFLGLLATFLTGVQTDAAITNAAPPSWIYAIGVAGSFITAGLVHAKKAEPVVDSTKDVAAMIDDIKNVLAGYRAAGVADATQVATKVATQAVTQAATQVASSGVKDVPAAVSQHVQDVQTAVNAAASAVGLNVASEIDRVISTYKSKLGV